MKRTMLSFLLSQTRQGGEMAQFLKIDPVSRDYVFSHGAPTETDDILTRTYFALTIPKNNWLYGTVNQGSLLYTLDNVKRTNSIEQRFASFAADAIQQQVIATGYASAVGVNNIASNPTGTSNQVEVVPTTTPVQSTLGFVSV